MAILKRPGLKALAVVGLAMMATALAVGGISYRKETTYRPASVEQGAPISVHVQSTPISTWGNLDFVGASVYGAPFDVFIDVELPADTKYTAVRLDTVVVSDGTVELRRAEGVEIPLAPVLVMQGGTRNTAMASWYAATAAFSTTPRRISVHAKGSLVSQAGTTPIETEQSFDLVESARLHVGKWMVTL